MRSLAYVRLGEENGGIIVNLSECGMAVRSVIGVGNGRIPILLFPLARDSIATSGRVAWKYDAGKLAGIQFVDTPEPMRDLIRNWIAEESAPRVQHEAKTATDSRDRRAAEPSPKATATDQKELRAGVEKQGARYPVSMPVPARPASNSAGKNSTVPSAATTRGAHWGAISAAPRALLIVVVAALSVVAGWATEHYVSRAFVSTSYPKVAKPQVTQPMDSSAGIANVRKRPPAASRSLHFEGSSKQGWIFLGEITPQSTWAADSPRIVRNARWPIKKGDDVTISHDVWMRDGSRPAAHVVGRVRDGQRVFVEEVTLLHKRRGGNFVWAKVSTAPVVEP